jgi:hypothetical protein
MKVAETTTYKFTNTHPKGIKTSSDCVYRALSIATGKEWLEVYDELHTLGRELLAPPNDMKTVSKYLDDIAVRHEVMYNGRRLTGANIASSSNKTYVVRTAGHLAAIVNGKVRDTWDSSKKPTYIIWEL